MTSPSPFDPGIPVLTEVLDDVPAKPAPPPAVWRTGAAKLPPPAPAVVEHAESGETVDWSALEQRLHERILVQLLPVLERRVEAAMAQALAHLATDLRSHLHEAVLSAVQEELAAVRSPKR
jgi:hypothetical protein